VASPVVFDRSNTAIASLNPTRSRYVCCVIICR
jgi:hypothetical protein